MGAVAVFRQHHHPNHQTLPRMTSITPVILCGGLGTRLWPLSRKSFPKQTLVFDDRSHASGKGAGHGVARAHAAQKGWYLTI
jgi:hypothetical protein